MQRFFLAILRCLHRMDAKSALLNKKIKFSTLMTICFCVYAAKCLLPSLVPMPETFIKPITRDVIIFATFFYKNSTSFGTAGKDTIVVLMLADHTDQFPNARCARQQINNKTLAPVVPKLTRYDYTGLCKLVLFMAFCHFSFENGTGLTDQLSGTDQLIDQWNGEGIMIDMGIQVLADAHLHQYSAPIYHTLPVRMADRTPRTLVICISRLFAFEKWQLLFIAMETYKKLGVDFVVLHVISALSAVYELIKTYEAEGRLAVRNGLQLPFSEFMNFDPALQIEYSGQLAMAHECFYEFRESAKFIAMLDLDDLLISTKFPSLITALNAALVAYPMAPYFFINKRESGILLSRHNNNNNKNNSSDFAKQFHEMILTKNLYNSEKLVLRPDKIEAFWIHFTNHYAGQHKPVQLSTDYMLILHISREIEHKHTNEYHEKLLAKTNWTTSNIGSNYLNKSKINEMIKRMPKTLHYFDAIRRCSRFINSYPTVPVHVIPPCLSYKLCALPRPKVKCTVTKSNYKLTEIKPTNLYRVHVLQQSYFEKKAGCFD